MSLRGYGCDVPIAIATLTACGLLVAIFAHPTAAQQTDYSEAIAQVEEVANREVEAGHITGVSIALVDDQRIVHSGGFGMAHKERGVTAGPETVYRVGSISKLFTAIGAMRLVEQRQLDLDAPITDYDPALAPVKPFDAGLPITLRRLMSHRSGMFRESPVGGYFDDSEPSPEAVVRSIQPCVLTYRPGDRTKYSNIGVSLVGHITARRADQPFVDYQQRQVLAPLGMNRSAFLPDDTIREHLATGYLYVAQPEGGFREIESPRFELGTIPAGNLYSTAEDLGRFVSMLFADGRAGDTQMIRHATLQEMFTPQQADADTGFGLGFLVGTFRGHKTVQHSGAVYGFTSSLVALPEEKLAVIVLANDDITTGPVDRISDAALGALLQAKLDEQPPVPPQTVELPQQRLAAMAGQYESESYWAELTLHNGQLSGIVSGQPLELQATSENTFRASGRLWDGSELAFERDAEQPDRFRFMDQIFRRVRQDQSMNPPERWQQYVGSYGPDFIPLIVSIRHGHLYMMTENLYDYRLRPVNTEVFACPPGLYEGEEIVFQRNAGGEVYGVILANMPLARRPAAERDAD
ncbi:MAG: serine hydrolase domain-containing protein [Pirellulales bacterium]